MINKTTLKSANEICDVFNVYPEKNEVWVMSILPKNANRKSCTMSIMCQRWNLVVPLWTCSDRRFVQCTFPVFFRKTLPFSKGKQSCFEANAISRRLHDYTRGWNDSMWAPALPSGAQHFTKYLAHGGCTFGRRDGADKMLPVHSAAMVRTCAGALCMGKHTSFCHPHPPPPLLVFLLFPGLSCLFQRDDAKPHPACVLAARLRTETLWARTSRLLL